MYLSWRIESALTKEKLWNSHWDQKSLSIQELCCKISFFLPIEKLKDAEHLHGRAKKEREKETVYLLNWD